MHRFIPSIVLLIALAASNVKATPTADGKFDPNEGYTTGYYLNLSVESGPTLPNAGELWYYQDSTTKDLFVYFTVPVTLVDNSYGVNSIGWGSDAPSGKNHKFEDLLGSDKAQIQFTDSTGKVVFEFIMDYMTKAGTKSSPTYASLGATGGDGKVLQGSASSLLDWGSTLDYNFNVLGHVLTKDSPATDSNYTENPNYAGWIYEVGYEMQIAGNLFGSGFGDVNVLNLHASPNKLGKNVITTTRGDDIPNNPIPEPASMALLSLGALCMLRRPKRAV